MRKVNPAGGSGEKEGRDGACTPKWLADLIGRVDVDPCSNPRSHVGAEHTVSLPGDGCMPSLAGPDDVVFVNPPYARGQVLRWVMAHRHTRFIFLLRWDPSTKWFAELYPHCTHVWFPRKRVNFEPPPGVKFSANPYPHALYMRDPAQELLARLSPHGYLLDVRLLRQQDVGHEDKQVRSTGDGGGRSGGAEAAASGSGESAGVYPWCEECGGPLTLKGRGCRGCAFRLASESAHAAAAGRRR